MKKIALALVVLLTFGSLAFAASGADSLIAPGNISVLAGLGTGFFTGIDVYAGAEYDFGSFNVTDAIPITYGAGVRVGYWGWSSNLYVGYDWKESDISLAALAIAHVSWKDILPDMAWLAKFDSYVGLGLGAYFYSWDYAGYYGSSADKGTEFHPGFASVGGTNWFVTKNIAVNFEGGYYGYGGAGRIGVLFKL